MANTNVRLESVDLEVSQIMRNSLPRLCVQQSGDKMHNFARTPMAQYSNVLGGYSRNR